MNKSSWTELIEINRKKCEDIVACSKNVRYAGCFNEYGRTIAGKIRPGVKPVFSPNVIRDEELHKIVMYVVNEKFTEHHYEHVECPDRFTV